MRTAVKDLKPGPVDSTFLVTKAESAKTRADKTYMRFTFADVTGSVSAVDWTPTPERCALQAGAVIPVKGSYSVDATYGPQIVVKGVGLPVVGFNVEDFAAQCPNDMRHVRQSFDNLLNAIDPTYASFLRLALDEEGDKSGDFWTAPAASVLHQAYAGGLAEHSVQVAHMAYVNGKWCRGLDETVLVAAGLLHDISKPVEFEGISREQTNVSKLVGNTTLSYQAACELLRLGMEKLPDLKFDDRMENIRHCIIAHHGRRDWGSPVVPRTMEAWLVHLADMVSSRIGGYQRLLRDTPEGQEWTARDLMFEGQLWIPQNSQGEKEVSFQESFTFPEVDV